MNSSVTRFDAERRFYVLAAIGIGVVVLAGFSIDYGLLFDLRSLSVLVLIHALVMFGWIGLFFMQTALVARGHVDLHRRIGILGATIAVLVVVVGAITLLVATRLGGKHMPPGISKALFLAFGSFNLLTFAVLVGAAIGLRRRAAWHKRLMLLAAILLLDAALARFISAYTSWTVDAATLRNLLALVCVAVDVTRYRRLHPAFIAGGLLVITNDYFARWISATQTWTRLVSWLT
ncbi:MAG: hypothetical protein ACREVV_17595 [Steroidobacteraceae bacterium]